MEIVDVLDPELKKKLLENFPKETNGYVQVGPSKYLFPVKYRRQALEYLDFKLRPDDVWVVTFPRSGTTVMQELLWLLAHDLDYKRATEEPMNKRSRFFEASILFSEMEERQMLKNAGGDKQKEENVLRICGSRVPLLDADTSPRVIKTHLPLSLLPAKLLDTCKVVYMARNPRDVSTSYYLFHKENNLSGYQGDLPNFWNLYRQGHLTFGPHWQHIAEAWQHRNHPNLLFEFYENFITDNQGSIERIASHIGKQMDQDQIEKLQDHLKIENFRKNKSVQIQDKNDTSMPEITRKNLVRKGKNNDWQEHFTPEMKIDSENLIAEIYKALPDFKFPSV